MSRITYTATEGLDLLGTEVGAWLNETTPGTATGGVDVSADMSATGIDLDVTGTLTKTAVATGAELCGYSGWSTSNYLARVYGADLDITDEITLMAFIKPSSFGASRAICGNSCTGSGDYGGCLLYLNTSGYLSLLTVDNAGGVIVTQFAQAVSLTAWSFVVGTVNTAGATCLYINGVLVATSTSAVIGATSTVFKVGAQLVSGSLANPFAGEIAAVKVINGVLTAAQILNIYNAEKTLFKPYSTFRQVGESYSLDIVVEDESPDKQVDSTAIMSMGGNQETIERSRYPYHSLTYGSIARVPVAGELLAKQVVTEFLESVQGGETFTLDIYGSVASPDDPVSVIADPGYKFARTGNNLFTVSQRVREI